jgi:hypothetical protein
MGVAGHDLAGSYQKAHDRCAIWNVLSKGLDSFLVTIMASQHLNNTKATNVQGAQLHTFSIGLKVMIDLD